VEAEYAPSSCQQNFDIPPVNARADIPSDWRFVLCCAAGIRYSGASERAFFARHCPIPKAEVYQTLACVYHELLPAVVEAKIHRLKAALEHVHDIGFKRRELSCQSGNVRSLFRSLKRFPNCAVGMSSMGPLVFAIIRSNDVDALRAVRLEARKAKARVLGVFSGRNESFEFA
jgi:beta-ribofuranosylaminobenzene 5'-phosphate synthase